MKDMKEITLKALAPEFREALILQIGQLEYCVRQKAEHRNLPNPAKQALFEAVDNLIAAQRILLETQP